MMARTTTAIFYEGQYDQASLDTNYLTQGKVIGIRAYQGLSDKNKGSCFCSECGWKLHLRLDDYFVHNRPSENTQRPWCSTMVYVNDRGVVTRESDIQELQKRGLIIELDFPPLQINDPQVRQPNDEPVTREAPRHFTSIDTLAQHLPVYLNRAMRVNDEVRIISDMLISSELHGDMQDRRSQGPFIWFARIVQFNSSFHNFLNFQSEEFPNAFQLTKEATSYRGFNAGNTEGRVIMAYGEYGTQVKIDDGRKVGRLPEIYEFLLGY
jgi:hypothetical protein